MNTYTGQIRNFDTEALLQEAMKIDKKLKAMVIPPTPEQCSRGYVSGNDFCPCGSQLKFKNCCMTLPEKLG